ncbi:MAG: ABC transporter ATP-binding protein [Butyrivibrio sp.]|nr:ABC transporter ATP-binding protein [Butyrivibrio sp.]
MDIECCNVSKVINGRKIIDNISLSIPDGTVYGVIGPNGAGKTTMVRLMLNLYEMSEGTIRIGGVDVTSHKFAKVKSKIGVLLDSLGLYQDLNAWDNVEFFDRIYFPKSSDSDRHTRISHALELVDMQSHADEKITYFSRGMRQRLALARAFDIDPELLIMDEPTRGLDLEGQFAVRKFVEQMKEQGRTVVINSHNLGELQKVCDCFGFIRGGQLVEEGTYEELKAKYSGGSEVFDLEDVYKQINGLVGEKYECI